MIHRGLCGKKINVDLTPLIDQINVDLTPIIFLKPTVKHGRYVFFGQAVASALNHGHLGADQSGKRCDVVWNALPVFGAHMNFAMRRYGEQAFAGQFIQSLGVRWNKTHANLLA